MKKTTFTIISLLVISSSIFLSFKLARPEKTQFKVQYAVECSVCDIAYRDEENRTVIKENVNGKWNYTYTGKKGHYAYISAQAYKNNSTASVKIIIDGKEKEADASEDKLISAKAAQILYAD